MKKLLFTTVLALIFMSCEDKFQLEPGAMISIRPASSVQNSSLQKVKADQSVYEHLSDMEIVKQTIGLSFQNVPLFGNQAADRGFSDSQRDTLSDPPCLKMFGTDIIYEGRYYADFIESTDCILFRALNNQRDTIGYISNSILRNAEIQIKTAFANEDIEEVYRIFNEAFTFIPATGAEWRALKANNEN